MKLEELLRFDTIVIQCHDNPDADAIASGYGVLTYFQMQGRNARLIYGGSRQIQKSNLVLMTEILKIPIEHVQTLEEEPELLLTVDCQYGEKNVQHFSGKTLAVIDHHKVRQKTLPALREIRDNYGACSVIVWDMLCRAGVDVREHERLATALYYGLFMDTGKMQELRHPKDRDLRDQLQFACNESSLFQFQNSNLSLEELKIAGRALADYDYHPEHRFAIVEAERCDPNILGVISDMLIEVDAVDTCIAYCMLEDGAKISVRSSTRETRADELAAYICAGLGSGGGHPRKSGGYLQESLLIQECEDFYDTMNLERASGSIHHLLAQRMVKYFGEQDMIYAGTDQVPDLSREQLYQKKCLPVGYVRATDLYPAGTRVIVRMLEGDLPFTIQEDTYFMIGIEGEVYRNDEAYFLSHNELSDIPYQYTGECGSMIHEAVSVVGLAGQVSGQKSLVSCARSCVPKKGGFVHAKRLVRRTKVFVSWSESYFLGEPGDWLVARAEDPADVYIVKAPIFAKSYEMAGREM